MSSNVGDHRFILELYAAPVAIAGAAGYLTGTFVSSFDAPRLLFLMPFPSTSTGFTTYGTLTVALVLDVPLALVVYTSAGLGDIA